MVTGAQVEAKIQVRKLKKDLRLENMWLFTTMLASGLAVKVEEWGNKFETLEWCFAKTGEQKML